jgi:hypothetical protein
LRSTVNDESGIKMAANKGVMRPRTLSAAAVEL